MNCPVCGEKMRDVERFGVEIDICPGCKGVWLDRGELEKIIGFEEKGFLPQEGRDAPEGRKGCGCGGRGEHHGGHGEHHGKQGEHGERYGHGEHHDEKHGEKHGWGHGHHGRRKGSILGEIFGAFGGDD